MRMHAPLLTVLALVVATPTPAATTFTVTPVGDTSVNEAAATTSYGTLTARRVDGSPATAPPATGLDVGAYWYGWYGSSGRHWQDGYVRHVLSTPQRPQLGEYDSRDANVIATQLGWARQAGVDHLISSWWGQGSYEDVTTRDYLLASPAIGTTRVALLYESLALLPVASGVITFDATAEAKLIADVDYMARAYFANPHYERVDGKPVVYLYVTRVWRGAYAHAIATLRSTIRARYGYNLYLVGDEVDWDGSPVAERIGLFDAITAYTMYSGLQTPGWPADTLFLDGVRSRYRQFQAVARANGVRFIPDAMPGFNDRGVRPAANHYVLPLEVSAAMPTGSWSLFSGMLDAAAPFIDATRPMLTVTSWNEWHEDTEIEPTAPATTSTGPATSTQGYAFPSHGTKLLDILGRFSAAHGAGTGAGGGGGTPPVTQAMVTTAVAKALAAAKPAKAATLVKKGFPVSITAPAAGVFTVTLGRTKLIRVHDIARTQTKVLAKLTINVAAPGLVKRTVKLTRAGKALLRKSRKVNKLKLTVSFKAAALSAFKSKTIRIKPARH
jgi:hypothetical protein